MVKTFQVSKYIFKGIRVIIGVLLSYMLYSCSDCEPLDDPGNTLVVSFYSKDFYDSTQQLVAVNTNISSFSSFINDIDSVVAFDSISTFQYGIPLPLDKDTITFSIKYPEELILTYELDGEIIPFDTLALKEPDNLGISFSKSFETLSPDCGFITKYDNINITSTSFEKAEINFDYIQDNDSTNVRIFF